MNRLKASFKVNTTQFDIDFTDKICVLYDNSGTGKSYLLKSLRTYAESNNIKYTFFDYKADGMAEKEVIERIKGNELVLFNNADLYMTNNIIKAIKQEGVLAIMELRSVVEFDLRESGYYRVKYEVNNVITKRLR